MAVLSIQSHVVFGYAGNTAAVFPLQRLGREVWAVNTVEFSNHTGYGAWKGKALGANLVSELVSGIEERGALIRCEAVLSGYLGDADIGSVIIDTVKKTRSANPQAVYTCDPVMGDAGRGFYVKPDIPSVFREKLVPLADIVSPNQFELETLTETGIKNLDDAVKAVNILHEMGPSIVLVTSFREKINELSMIASDKKNMYIITTPELPLGNGAAGTGDITSSVFLARYLETRNLKKTLELCAASVFGILESSYKRADFSQSGFPVELDIINAQQELVVPSNFFMAKEI